jgi:hypothetical protein
MDAVMRPTRQLFNMTKPVIDMADRGQSRHQHVSVNGRREVF